MEHFKGYMVAVKLTSFQICCSELNELFVIQKSSFFLDLGHYFPLMISETSHKFKRFKSVSLTSRCQSKRWELMCLISMSVYQQVSVGPSVGDVWYCRVSVVRTWVSQHSINKLERLKKEMQTCHICSFSCGVPFIQLVFQIHIEYICDATFKKIGRIILIQGEMRLF